MLTDKDLAKLTDDERKALSYFEAETTKQHQKLIQDIQDYSSWNSSIPIGLAVIASCLIGWSATRLFGFDSDDRSKMFLFCSVVSVLGIIGARVEKTTRRLNALIKIIDIKEFTKKRDVNKSES